jgi:hypothetical protein
LKQSPIPIAQSLHKSHGPVVSRSAVITACIVFLALPCWAQRGGGGGGHMAGRAGAAGSSVGRGRSLGAMQGGSGSSPAFSNRPALPDHSHGMRGNRFETYRSWRNRFRNCSGYGCWGYGYPWWAYNYPYWWGGYDPSYDPDYERDHDLAEQMDPPNRDQEMPRAWGGYGPPYPYAPPPSRPTHSSASEPQEGAAIIPATVLVFHDHHQQEIRNYAIYGQTLWNFLPQQVEKISLNELDLAATIKANDERGLSFRLPSSRRS